MIYLDHNATTPVNAEVRAAMLPWLGEELGNPSSAHDYGRRAAAAVAAARERVAELIAARPEEIVFTSGGTESNNWALFGLAAASSAPGRILTSAIEHPAVLEPLSVLESRGWTVERLPVTPAGIVDLTRARAQIEAGPVDLVSVMTAHNETGAIQPVAGLARLARASAPGVRVHTDAAQAVGKIPVDVRALDVDLLTIAGHKLYAPKGIGALWIREGLELPPLLFGGGQQGGRRPGTEPVPAIVGLGVACARASATLADERARLQGLRERLFAALAAGIPGLQRTLPSVVPCLPNTLHVCVPGRLGADLLAACPELAASTGSACHAGDATAFEAGVLGAMGVSPEVARGALRLSLGRATTEADVDAAATALVRAAVSNPA